MVERMEEQMKQLTKAYREELTQIEVWFFFVSTLLVLSSKLSSTCNLLPKVLSLVVHRPVNSPVLTKMF